MKKIVLLTKGKRMLARLIDFLILLATSSIIYFAIIYPTCFDANRYADLSRELVTIYVDSGLFLSNSKGRCAAKSNYKDYITTVGQLNDVSITIGDEIVEHNNLLKDLYIYYTTKNVEYGEQVNFTYESYCKEIIKVNTEESNIASFDKDTYKITLMDESKQANTVSFFLTEYEKGALIVGNSPQAVANRNESGAMTRNFLLLIIPVVCGLSLIFDGLIPLFAPYGQTIGKFIFHAIVLTDQGHRVKKYKIMFRWFIYLLELALGVVTIGTGLLIPYTMFLFTKKRQALHDKIAKTVVANGDESIFFDTMAEEAYYINRMKERGDESIDSSGKRTEE